MPLTPILAFSKVDATTDGAFGGFREQRLVCSAGVISRQVVCKGVDWLERRFFARETFHFSEDAGNPEVGAWENRYQQGDTGWDRGSSNPALAHWLKQGALRQGKVLVPGCGRGHEVIELCRQGFEVTAIDFAESPIRELTRSLLEQGLVANVLREDVLKFSSDIAFSAIYEQTCLCALDPKYWVEYEQQLASNLEVGGRLFALFMQSDAPDGPPFHCGLEKMRELFGPSRWRWNNDQFRVVHPDWNA